MRIWSLHPCYLDTKGLLAAWREALLAKKVLEGQTKGYTHHPQLIRFRSSSDPFGFINAYLSVVYDESLARGYSFDGTKFARPMITAGIPVTRGQLVYEFALLREKLRLRDQTQYNRIKDLTFPELNPIFQLVPGDIEAWEKVIPGIL